MRVIGFNVPMVIGTTVGTLLLLLLLERIVGGGVKLTEIGAALGRTEVERTVGVALGVDVIGRRVVACAVGLLVARRRVGANVVAIAGAAVVAIMGAMVGSAVISASFWTLSSVTGDGGPTELLSPPRPTNTPAVAPPAPKAINAISARSNLERLLGCSFSFQRLPSSTGGSSGSSLCVIMVPGMTSNFSLSSTTLIFCFQLEFFGSLVQGSWTHSFDGRWILLRFIACHTDGI
jgi:hypothetical protein